MWYKNTARNVKLEKKWEERNGNGGMVCPRR